PATTASSVSPPDFKISIARCRQLTPFGSTPRFGMFAPFELEIITGRACPSGFVCVVVAASDSRGSNGAANPANAPPVMNSLLLICSLLIGSPDSVLWFAVWPVGHIRPIGFDLLKLTQLFFGLLNFLFGLAVQLLINVQRRGLIAFHFAQAFFLVLNG